MFRSMDYYIDLGTANTLIYARKIGFLLNEPTVLALKHRSFHKKENFALGKQAKAMLGKNPEQLSVLRPLREGVISDIENTTRLLHGFVKLIKINLPWSKPRMILSLPCVVSEFEKRAVEEVGYDLGARRVHLLDEPLAAAIGAGLPVLGSRGQMIVDIGGGTTEIVVVSLGGIVASQAVRIGGDTIDAGIIECLRSQYGFLIGEQTAERLKIHVSNALLINSSSTQKRMTVGGFNVTTGLPGKLTVTPNMIFPALNGVICEIISAIRKIFDQCPPEISGDVADNGIVLAGGGALIGNLKRRLAQDLGVPVRIAETPLMSVALGGAQVLENSKLLDIVERKTAS